MGALGSALPSSEAGGEGDGEGRGDCSFAFALLCASSPAKNEKGK